jgi:hypothetical protein
MSEPSAPEPEFEESRDGHERATEIVEERGLPEDNPFSEVVRDLHDDGESWQDIFDTMDAVHQVVDAAAYEEDFELIPEWRVAAVVPDEQSTSGERYEFYERMFETAEEAEESVERVTGYRVDTEKTEQVGVGKVS